MANRKPLVLNSGQVQQIQSPDLVDPTVVLSPIGSLSGLTLANNGANSKSISIAAGATTDSTNSFNMNPGTPWFKTLNSAWAVGQGSSGTPIGGLFTGSVAASTWYHVFLIRKDSDGTIDAGFDTSVTASHAPAGYTTFRRIGSILTDGSSNVRSFVQTGDWFFWNVPANDVNGVSLVAATFTTKSLAGVPPGVATLAMIYGSFNCATVGGALFLSDMMVTAIAQFTIIQVVSTAFCATGPTLVMTDTSQQVQVYCSNTITSALYLSVQGYMDTRGK